MPNQRVVYTFVGLDRFTAVAERVRRSVGQVQTKFKSAGAASMDFSKSLKRASSEMAFFAAKATAVGIAIGSLGVFAITQAAKFEQFEVAFATLAGSAEKGVALFNELKTFAAKTPFQLEGIAESAKILLAFGIQSDKVTDNLRMLGDLAAGTGKPLEEFALIFGKIKAKGKVTGEELQQLAEKGINLRESIGTKFGLSTTQVEKAISKGAVKFEHVLAVMQEMTSEGGRFFNMMEKQSRTTAGKWSTLKDNISLAAAEIGKVLISQLKLNELMDRLSGFLERVASGFAGWAKANPGLMKFGLILAGIVIAMGPLLLAVAGLGVLSSALVGGFGILAGAIGLISLPVLGVTALIGLLITAGVMLVRQWENVKLIFGFLAADIAEKIGNMKQTVSDFFTTGKIGAVLEFFGVGGAEESRSQTDINVNIAGPKGAVESVKSKTSGAVAGLNLGVNMKEAL